MTTEDLSRRLVSLTGPAMASGLPKFRWRPGMCDLDRYRCVEKWNGAAERYELHLVHEVTLHHEEIGADTLPDPSDPATLGCLGEMLVPEAWGRDVTIMHVDGPRLRSTTISTLSGTILFRAEGPKAERLVLALEHAP